MISSSFEIKIEGHRINESFGRNEIVKNGFSFSIREKRVFSFFLLIEMDHVFDMIRETSLGKTRLS